MRIGLSLSEPRGAPSLPSDLTSPSENFLKSPFAGSRLPDVELFPGATYLPGRLLGGSGRLTAPGGAQSGAQGSSKAPRKARRWERPGQGQRAEDVLPGFKLSVLSRGQPALSLGTRSLQL